MLFPFSAHNAVSLLLVLQIHVHGARIPVKKHFQMQAQSSDLNGSQLTEVDDHHDIVSHGLVRSLNGNATQQINMTKNSSSLVQHEIILSGVLALAATMYAVVETTIAATPEILLTVFSADVLFHEQSLTFWAAARNVCGGAVNWLESSSWNWGNIVNIFTAATQEEQRRRKMIEEKMTLVGAHIDKMCGYAEVVPLEFWTAVHIMCHKGPTDCGDSVTEFTFGGAFQTLRDALVTAASGTQDVKDGFCLNVYESSKMTLDVCNIDYKSGTCELFDKLDDKALEYSLETAAKQMSVDKEQVNNMVEKAAIAGTVGYHTVTAIANPVGKLAYWVTKVTGLDQWVKDLLQNQLLASLQVMTVNAFGTDAEREENCESLVNINPVQSIFDKISSR